MAKRSKEEDELPPEWKEAIQATEAEETPPTRRRKQAREAAGTTYALGEGSNTADTQVGEVMPLVDPGPGVLGGGSTPVPPEPNPMAHLTGH